MKTQTQNQKTEEKTQRQNQLIFIEYEKPTAEGHFMTIMDSYRNVIGRVNKSFNERSKKFEYAAFDHTGKPFSNGEKLWEVKNEFVKNRETLLEQAHQRRIESKEKSQAENNDRKNDLENIRQGKTGVEKQNEKTADRESGKSVSENNVQTDDDQNQFSEREQELDDIRNDKDYDRDDMDLER